VYAPSTNGGAAGQNGGNGSISITYEPCAPSTTATTATTTVVAEDPTAVEPKFAG